MIRAAILALLIAAACQQAPSLKPEAKACAFSSPPSILQSSGDPHAANGRLLQVWDVPNDPVLWSDATPTEGGYPDFRRKLASADTETGPLALLQASPTPNNAVVTRNAAAWIRPASCLEKLLVGQQHARMDTFIAPTEFASLILRSPDNTRLHIYSWTINQDGIGRMSPLTDAAAPDLAVGWRIAAMLHPHNFHPGQPQLNGILAPSEPDADFARNFAAGTPVEASWITNGLHTVRIPASAFGDFPRQ